MTVANAGTTAVTLNDAEVLGQAFVNTQVHSSINLCQPDRQRSSSMRSTSTSAAMPAIPAGLPIGRACWRRPRRAAQSVQAARAGLVGQFVHDLIDFDLTPGATALGLTAAQYQEAQTREAAINDKIAVSLAYSNDLAADRRQHPRCT